MFRDLSLSCKNCAPTKYWRILLLVARLCKEPMGRLRDAWETLRGQRDYQIRQSALTARIAAEWTAICTEIEATMENLTRLDARLKKREQRAKKREEKEQEAGAGSATDPQLELAPTSFAARKARKDALRARSRVPATLPVASRPLNGSQGEFEQEEAP